MNDLKKNIIYIGLTFDLSSRLRYDHFDEIRGCNKLKHQSINSCLNFNNSTGQIEVFKYSPFPFGVNFGQFIESYLIEYAYDNLDDFQIFSNKDLGRNVILIHNNNAKINFTELILDDVYENFVARTEGIDTFAFDLNMVKTGNLFYKKIF